MNTTSYFFLVADIETSTLFNDLNEPTAVWLSYGWCKLYSRDFCTIERCYFREWETLRDFLLHIEQKFIHKKILCFVHNLGYEFDFFIKNLSMSTKFLTNSSHAVISTVLDDFPQIDFRCTFRLTMQPLRKLGEQVGLPKLEDDYELLNPEDEVPIKSIQYCERDCDVVAKWVCDYYLKEYGSFAKAPLTKTGRVRKTYNQYYYDYCKAIGGKPSWDLMPDEDCYQAENDAFAGGITTSNPMFTGIVLKDVQSYDISSSYPYAQLSEEYPYEIHREYNPKLSMMREKFWIAKIRFKNIQSKFDWGWLSVSKMNDYDAETSNFFNGKLINTAWCIRTITNVDFETIKLTYEWDELEILEFYHMPTYGELPKPYIDTINEYAKAKSDMKSKISAMSHADPDFMELNIAYMLIKGDFNSIYGMTVQKIIQSEYEIDDDYIWHEKKITYQQENKHIKRNFLFGVYVTAYARRNLIRAIVVNCPKNFVYCDTDSVKFIGGTKFVDTNKLLDEKYLAIPYLKGLGRFDEDAMYAEFLTYGAKKYCYKLYNDDNVYLTVAGLPKYKADEDNDIVFNGEHFKSITDVRMFRLGLIFKNCKLGKKYITSLHTFEIDDYGQKVNYKDIDEETSRYLKKHNIKTNGGVALFPCDYTLDMTKEDKIYINHCRRYFDKWVQEQTLISGIPYAESISMMLPIG